MDAGRSFERSELQLNFETSVSELDSSSGMPAVVSGASLSQFLMVIRGMAGSNLVNRSITRSEVCRSLEETESVEVENGRQLIEPVSVGVDVTLRCRTGLSARFPFTIACKEMTLVFRS